MNANESQIAESLGAWTLHDGVEAMYQEPLGRSTPVVVIRIHTSMASIELESGSRCRCSIRRLRRPTFAEALTHFAYARKGVR